MPKTKYCMRNLYHHPLCPYTYVISKIRHSYIPLSRHIHIDTFLNIRLCVCYNKVKYHLKTIVKQKILSNGKAPTTKN